VLNVVPSHVHRKSVAPLHYKTMIQKWLRAPIFERDFVCPCCNGMVDRYGDHCLTCSGFGDRIRRHNTLRNEVYYLCVSCNLSPQLEKPGLLCPRPADGAVFESGGQIQSDPTGRRLPSPLETWHTSRSRLRSTSGLGSNHLAASMADGGSATRIYDRHNESVRTVG
jgi:hypothetical protein